MLPVGRRKVELVVNIPRLYCKDCGTIKQPHLAFADPKKHYTRSLERFVIDLCRVMSIQDAAELTGLGWDTVKEIHKRHLRRKYKSFDLKKVRYIAIDEVYLGKKRKYITIVLDLREGRVIHVGRGKGKDALRIRILKDAARKLSVWKPFILNWHKHRISTGKLEVINSKIGTLQRNAYGYRDDEYLKLRIFNLHRSTYALIG